MGDTGMLSRSSWQIGERATIPLCTSQWLARQPGLVHGFAMREFNLSLHSGPDAGHSARRRKQFCEALGVDFDRLTVARQVHGAEVVPVDTALAGAGRDALTPAIPHVDGMVTTDRGIGLMGMSADCPIVLLYDPHTPALGVAHAGWRGTVAGIASRLVEQMQRSCGSRPDRLLAAISPCAGPDQYEVREDVVRVAAARWNNPQRYFTSPDGRCFLNLRLANADQLQAAGVPHEHIDIAGFCTIRDERFFSYRRDGAATGHAALLAALT